MDKVLIAYNNDSTTILHDFLESCADEAKQICADNGIEYSSVYPPNLSEQNVIGAMPEHQFCFFAGHGDPMEFTMRMKTLLSQYIQPTTISRTKVFIVLLVLALKSFIHI